MDERYAAKMAAENPPIARAVKADRWATAVEVEASESSTAAVGRNIPHNTEDGIKNICARGMPPGLAEVVATSSHTCTTRYWIVDNSSSMQIQVRFPMQVCYAQVC